MVKTKLFVHLRYGLLILAMLISFGVREYRKVVPMIKTKVAVVESKLKRGYVCHVRFMHVPCGSIDVEAQ